MRKPGTGLLMAARAAPLIHGFSGRRGGKNREGQQEKREFSSQHFARAGTIRHMVSICTAPPLGVREASPAR